MIKKRNFQPVKYVFYFIAFSFLGSLMEYIFGFFGGSGIAYDRGLYELLNLRLYFIPYYGFVGLILVFFEKFLEKKKIKFIHWGILNAIVIVSWELIGGLFSMAVFGRSIWDYSNHFFNFLGIISLDMFLLWICVGYLFSFIYRYIISFLNRFLL